MTRTSARTSDIAGAAPTASDPGPARRAALRPALLCLGGFLVVSVAMEAVLASLTAVGIPIDIAVWIRCTLVLGSAVVLLLIARGAARGGRPSWVRLSIIAPVVVVAVVVIVSIPGFLPDWVRLEQALCGLLVLPAAVVANLPRTRALFPREA